MAGITRDQDTISIGRGRENASRATAPGRKENTQESHTCGAKLVSSIKYEDD